MFRFSRNYEVVMWQCHIREQIAQTTQMKGCSIVFQKGNIINTYTLYITIYNYMIDGVDTMSSLCLLCATMYHHLIMFHFDAKKGNNTGTLQEKIEHCLYINDLRGNIRGLAMRYATQELVSGYVTMSHGDAWWRVVTRDGVWGEARRESGTGIKKEFFWDKKKPHRSGAK